MGPHPTQPRDRRSADPRPIGAHGAWIAAAFIAVAVVVLVQQFTLWLTGDGYASPPRSVVESEAVSPPGVAEFTVLSKLHVKSSGAGDEGDDPVASLAGLAISRTDRVRLAIVAGELSGRAAAVARLEELAEEVVPGGDLAADIRWLTELYRKGPGRIPAEAQRSLTDRHGWFGRLALASGVDDADPFRRSVVSGGGRVLGFMALFVLVSLGAAGAGLVCSLVLLVKLGRRRLTMRHDAGTGGRVYLETFAVFSGAFAILLLTNLLFFGLAVEGTAWAYLVGEIMMWALAPAAAWPVVRGLRWREAMSRIGLHRGEGVVVELASGLFLYLASIPLVVAAARVGVWIERLMTGAVADENPTEFPLFEAPLSGSWLVVILSSVSAVVWAPIAEELVFRGALHRYLRRFLAPWATVLVSSAVFGLAHPYSPAGLAQVTAMGLVLGLGREWRGSLVASMTAHFLHNLTITAFTVGLLVAVGD